MKRIASVVFSVVLLAAMISVIPDTAVSALDSEITSENYVEVFNEMGIDVTNFQNLLKESFDKCEPISIDQYNISESEINDFYDATWQLIAESLPEYDYFVINKTNGMSCSYNNYSGVKRADKLYFSYKHDIKTPNEMHSFLNKVNKVTDSLLEGLQDNNTLTEAEKALIVHDRLALHVHYDNDTLYGNNNKNSDSYYAYGALFNRKAVCAGYSDAYKYLMTKIKIKTIQVISHDLNHDWNIVFIDGVPYYVDVTWDDSEDRITHSNFLRSLNGIKETGHTSNDFDTSVNGIPINDSKYDDYYWQRSDSAFELIDNKIYYIDNVSGTLNKIDGDTEVLYSLPTVDSDSRLCVIDEWLVFSCSDKMYGYNLKTENSSIEIISSLDAIGVDSFCSSDNGDCSWKLKGNTLSVFGNGKMSDCGLLEMPLGLMVKKLEIEEGVTSIGDYAFSCFSALTNVIIPDTVTYIGSTAFMGCTGLTDISIPDSVTDIGSDAFRACTGLTEISIPDSVINIERYAFSECSNLKKVKLSNRIERLEPDSFSSCIKLTEITIPDSVKTINDYTFASCSSLVSVYLPENLSEIGVAAFANCSKLNNIVLPKQLTSIKDMAFLNCSSLSDLELPEGVTDIGYYVYFNCKKILSVTIPASVVKIDDYAFGYYDGNLIEDYFVITGYVGSEAERYANNNGLIFNDIENPTEPKIIPTEQTDSTESTQDFQETTESISSTDVLTESTITQPNTDEYTEPTETTEGLKPTDTQIEPTDILTEPTENYTDIDEPTLPQTIDISEWRVVGIKNLVYTGKALKQSNIIVENEGQIADFIALYNNNTNAGIAKIIITGTGKYTGTIVKTFRINKAKNPVKVSAKKTVKAKSKKKTIIKKAITVKKAKGKVTVKTNNKKIKVKNGRLIVAKGFKKGKRIKVRVTVNVTSDRNYTSKKVIKTIKVIIK